MKIRNVKLSNFRCYYGASEFEISENKITLFYADSGFGKTTLLQFFNWMFYDNVDFGQNNDKPFYNETAYNENSRNNKKTEVFGEIDFEHLGIKYRLTRKNIYFPNQSGNKQASESESSLLYLNGNNYVPINNNEIQDKINSIMPKELSKYFILNGEEAKKIVLNSIELKKAIYKLFKIDIYEEAIKHIGSKSLSNTVIGMLSKEYKADFENQKNIVTYRESMQNNGEELESIKNNLEEIEKDLEKNKNEKTDLNRDIGKTEDIEKLRKNEENIKKTIAEIEKEQKEELSTLGEIFYSTYSYLLLSDVIRNNIVKMKENLTSMENDIDLYFESDIRKDLLEEIIKKEKCICGECLTRKMKEYITNVINLMPPNSYKIQFGQFNKYAKKYITNAQTEKNKYNEVLLDVAKKQELQSAQEELLTEAQNKINISSGKKELFEKLREVEDKITRLEKEKKDKEKRENELKKLIDFADEKMVALIKKDASNEQINKKIQLFSEILEKIKEEKKAKEEEIKIMLNESIREIFVKLTTQSIVDPKAITFIDDNFALRKTYLAGGQMAIDVYSYIIGIITTLSKKGLEENENPLIIDAPFSFTDSIQSNRICKMLPKLKQSIILTFEKEKIGEVLRNNPELFDVYIIKNETQVLGTIERSSINDLNN